ncbi:MAG: helix-turn-helix transcriptional regulator [Lachnospiraceae bacterium]|nr:helix-turn-helix transcriptional regulator [Lachnospiraceae bacterium]
MDEFRYNLGQRLKNYRLHKGLSQEKLAELANCHPTYIGQLERGEKNATIESILKLSSALNISLSDLFDKLEADKIVATNDKISEFNYPLLCYDLILSKPIPEQKKLYEVILSVEKYKGNII